MKIYSLAISFLAICTLYPQISRAQTVLKKNYPNITLYLPIGLHIHLSEKRPDTLPTNYLCVPGAYTSISTQIEGLYINEGLVVSPIIDTKLTGACILGNESIKIIDFKEFTPEVIEATKTDHKSLFQQSLLVKNGQIVPCDLFGSKKNLRRAMIQFKDTYCVGESSIPVTIDEFQESLIKIGAINAVNLDMGTWSEGWYMTPAGGKVRIGEKMYSTHRQTNWIVYSR